MKNLQKKRALSSIYAGVISMVLFLAATINAHSQTLQWAKQFGSLNSDDGIAIATDGSGNVYSAGNFEDTIDFDPGPGTFNLISKGNKDIFISKLDSAGNFIWAKQIGGTGHEECNDIAVDDNGVVYITGAFLGITDFNPSADNFDLTSIPQVSAFICKLNASGDFAWAKKFGGSSSPIQPVSSYSIALDGSGNVYTTGYFDGTADFDPGSGVFNLTPGLDYTSDIFVSKLDASGDFIWAKQLGGTGFEAGYGIAADASGNVYTTGFFNGTVDFDPGTGTFDITAPTGETDIFVSKLDASGNFVWAKQVGGETGYAIAVDNAGNVYTSGYYSWDDISINKLDPSGNIIWTKQIGGDVAYSIAVDEDHNVYTTGQFFGTRDFDPGTGTFNMTAIGSSDAYITKLDQSGDLVWAKQLGGTLDVVGKCLTVDGAGNIYTTGQFYGTTDFDPSAASFDLTSVAGFDVFVHKMKPDNLGVGTTTLTGISTIYPNPTQGKFIIEFEKKYKDSDLVLRNMLGQVVYKGTVINSDQAELEITGAAGLYILEVHHRNGQKAIARIIKN